MAEQRNGKLPYTQAAQMREKELIEMLVKTEFPMKKRSKTSAEILNSIRDFDETISKGKVRGGRGGRGGGGGKAMESKEKLEEASNDSDVMMEKRNKTNDIVAKTKNKLDQFLEEMDKNENPARKTLGVENMNQDKMRRSSTILRMETSNDSSNTCVFRSPSLKLPPLDPRLLTTHSILTGDLSLGRNFKILGFNGEKIVEDALLKIGWQTFDYPAASGFYSHFSSSDSRRSAGNAGNAFRSPISSHSAPVHLTWADSPSRLKNSVFVEGMEMVNHVPNMALLSDKVKLYESLSTYERQVMGGGMRRPGLGIVGHIKMDRFVPTTFRVDVPTDRTRFYREFRSGQIWICKPANDNCGRGIFLVRSLEEFHHLITAYEELKSPQASGSGRSSQVSNRTSVSSTSPNSANLGANANLCVSANPGADVSVNVKAKPGANSAAANMRTQPTFHNHSYHRVVQKYIMNPLLIGGRKADLRAFLLVASTDPYVVLFRTGYVRLAMEQYNADGKSPFSHLTNQCVQKKHPEYEAKKDDSVLSMEKFNDFVNDYVTPKLGMPKDWVKELLPAEMKKIMVQCFQSIRLRLPSASSNGSFELLGFDFMLDDKLDLWLIEVNVNPSLATNNQTLATVIPSVVQEALYLAIECFEKQKVIRGPLTPLHARKNFEFIYEEFSSSKWIFGQNPSPRWNRSFAFSAEENARLDVSRRQALCPRIPLGSPIRGKWAAPHKENSPDAITAIAATKHLVETMRAALEDGERERRKRSKMSCEEEEEEEGMTKEEKGDDDVGKEEDGKEKEEAEENGKGWLRERWH